METFKSILKRAIKEAGLNQKKLSELTGISEKQISDYVHGTIPTQEKLDRLKEVLDLKPIQKESNKGYTLEHAASDLGMSRESLKISLVKNLIQPQIGIAVPHGNSYRYIIFEKRLKKFLNGEI